MKSFFALLLLLLVLPSHSLYLKMTTRFCFLMEEIEGKYRFQFEANSATTDNVTLSIVNRNGATIANENTHQKQMEINGDVGFTVCFINDDSEPTYVTLDIWHEKANLIKSLATKGDIHELHYEMQVLSQGLQNISRGEKFQEQRQDQHSSIILGFEGKIKWLGTAKILLIISLAVVEILILRWTLNDDSKLTI